MPTYDRLVYDSTGSDPGNTDGWVEHANVDHKALTGVAAQTKSVDATLAAGDSGYVTSVDTDGKTITLPATVVGLTYTIRNAGADGAVAVTVAPNAADKIQGVGITAADNKALVNTKATARRGDYVTLVGDGVDGWFVQSLRGTWARAA